MFKKTKIISFFLCITFLLSRPIYADDADDTLSDIKEIGDEIVQTTSNPENELDINSRAAIVIDRNSNTILYGKNENTIRKMASTTKIMTATIVIESSNLDDEVTISKKSAGTGGSRLGLKTGDKITVKNLLYGLMLCSGNDAAVALAEYVGGDIEGFCALMNQKADELGLENTNFESPHGLDSQNHYTTAYELALLANYALNNDTFLKIVSTKNYTITINGYSKNLSNTNELLGNLNGVYGIKTGFTNGANRCLVTACKRNNLDIICVVLGADTKKFRTTDSVKLIEYAFANYEPVNVKELICTNFDNWKSSSLSTFAVDKGQTNNIELKLDNLQYDVIPIKKDLINNLYVQIECEAFLNAPVTTDTVIGTAKIYNESTLICSANILTNCNINKKNIYDYFNYFIKNYATILNSSQFL